MLIKKISLLLSILLILMLVPAALIVASDSKPNKIADGSFESGNSVTVNNIRTFISDNTARTGSKSALIKVSDESQVARYGFEFYTTDYIPRAEYTLSLWYKGNIKSGSGIGASFFCYGNSFTANESKNQFHTKAYTPTDTWTELKYSFVCADDVQRIYIFIGLTTASGEVYIDDISLTMTTPPPKFTINTDNVFYYSDWETGAAEVTLDPYYAEKNYTAKFNIMNGDESLFYFESVFSNRKAECEFNISLLKEKKKQYFITADIYDIENNLIDSVSEEIYRYDRPTQMNQNDEFIEKGKVFFPVYVNRVLPEKYDFFARAGFNVVSWQFDTDIEVSLRSLDELYAHGFMAAVVCYWDMYPAGNPRNIERVAPYIEAVKNHPAIFCYKIMDEPYANDPVNATRDLRESYKMIRGIDNEHPVYVVESIAARYHDSGKYSDYLSIDPYPGNGLDYGTHVGDSTLLARKAVENKKPVFNILQAFTFGATKPTPTELHSMIYQALLGGSQGIGYFRLETPADGELFADSEYDAMVRDFTTYEKDILFSHFSSGRSSYFSKSQNDNLWYEIWADGENMYVAVQNRKSTDNKVSIPLINTAEDTVITGFDIEAVSSEETSVTAYNGGFSVSLAPRQACLLRLHNIIKSGYEKPAPSLSVILNGDFQSGLSGWTVQNASVTDGYAVLENGSLAQSFAPVGNKAAYKTEFEYSGEGTFTVSHRSKKIFEQQLSSTEGKTFVYVLRIGNNTADEVTLSFTGNLTVDNVTAFHIPGYDFDNLVTDPGFEHFTGPDLNSTPIIINPDGIAPWGKQSYIVERGDTINPIFVPTGKKMWHIPRVSGGALSIRIDSDDKPNTNAYADTGLTLSFDFYRTDANPFGIWIELVSPEGADSAGQYNGVNGTVSKTAIYHTDYHPDDAPTPGKWTTMTFDLSEVLKGRTPDLYDSAYQINLIFMTGHTSLYIDNLSLTENKSYVKFIDSDRHIVSELSSYPVDIFVQSGYFSQVQQSARLIIAGYIADHSGLERLCDTKVYTLKNGDKIEFILEDESNKNGRIIKAFIWCDGIKPLLIRTISQKRDLSQTGLNPFLNIILSS